MHQFIMHIILGLPFNSTIPNLWHIAAYKYNKVNIVVLWTGVWFLHCHLDDHLTWGLNTVFLVKNGVSGEEWSGSFGKVEGSSTRPPKVLDHLYLNNNVH